MDRGKDGWIVFFLIGTAIKEREERLLRKVYNGKNSESFHKYPPICRHRPRERIGNSETLNQ